jgi:hypothetical protein
MGALMKLKFLPLFSVAMRLGVDIAKTVHAENPGRASGSEEPTKVRAQIRNAQVHL